MRKKWTFLLLILVLCLVLPACGRKKQEPVEFVPGDYYLSGEGLFGQAVSFSAENHQWFGTASVFANFAFFGEYEVEGDRLIARENQNCVVITFELLPQNRLKVVKVENADGWESWFQVGDVYLSSAEAELMETTTAADLHGTPGVPTTESSSATDEELTTEVSSEMNEELSTEDPFGEGTVEFTKPVSTETTSEPGTTWAPETTALPTGPSVPEDAVKEMIRRGLQYVKDGYGYSLQDRKGTNGNFDCSGLVAVLLRDCFGCTNYGWDGNEPWDTAWWRSLKNYLNVGDTVQFGSVTYVVTMKDTEDYQAAWSVPGSIVVQYSPTNHPEKTMGHISVALGEIPYQEIGQVEKYIFGEYGVMLDGETVTGLPMIYDQYGPEAGHTIFKINANGVANCCIVDNNYASDPEWIEPVCLVFAPVR